MSVSRHAVIAGLVSAVIFSAIAVASSAEWKNPKVLPPRAKPQRRSAAEGIPPLPLPATPLRRSERKRQPAAPALVGMINFSNAGFVVVNGKRQRARAFPTTQIDIERLMKYANAKLKIRYRFVPTSLGKFSWDPAELPLLYITGWTAMPKLSEEMLGKLRRYLYDGGTLVLHAQCGRPEFVRTARGEIQRLFPDRKLLPIDTDSPLFHAYFDIGRMRVRKDSEPFKSMPPYIEAIYMGCRPAIIFSPIDLNCGWDVAANPIEGGILYHQDDAVRLGVNVITTVLANFQYARAWGTRKIFHQQAEKTRDQLVIAQIIHGGDWDPTPHALPNLMKYIQRNTTLNVQFKREAVDPSAVDVFKHPVLYLTGLRDFKFTDAQVLRLGAYLKAGGVLVADAAAGRKAFDVAFRREIKRVLPQAELKPIEPGKSPLFQMPFKIQTVTYEALVKARNPDLNVPAMEGISIDGQLGVIYSPLSLANGWEQLKFAYNRGYASDDSLRIGVNIFAYALTH